MSQHFLALDLGSSSTRAYYNNYYIKFPSVYGVNFNNPMNQKAIIGEQALKQRGLLSIRYPIFHGMITNSSANFIIAEAMSRLNFNPKSNNSTVILSEVAGNNRREYSLQNFMESIHVEKFTLVPSSILTLLGSSPIPSSLTGVVVESGSQVTSVSTIVNGVIVHSTPLVNVTGSAITDYFMKLLSEMGYCFPHSQMSKDQIQKIKEELAYVALDFEAEMEKFQGYDIEQGTSVTLSDETVIYPGNTLFRCTEAMFTPAYIGSSSAGIHHLIFQGISKAPQEYKDKLLSNIVLTGGNCLFPGLEKRIARELEKYFPSGKIQIKKCDEFASIKGAMLVGSNPRFEPLFITRKEYEMYGQNAINRLQYNVPREDDENKETRTAKLNETVRVILFSITGKLGSLMYSTKEYTDIHFIEL